MKRYQELPIGGVIPGGATPHLVQTGGWRSGKRPDFNEKLCINCLLCWVHCPEATIMVEGAQMRGISYDHCKGCGICSQSCPTGAIVMVEETKDEPVPSHAKAGEEVCV
ncbi:MAG: 4Fe-4S binding protein [Candidatus Bipolaricaulota bacterium]|nr:4Fe-4S binding protein [Candidatus Bipolaricaulota bacterium]MDW8030224.1 4Fe-4S binding protein [Candidatus Bipolaricaulota bacterium]